MATVSGNDLFLHILFTGFYCSNTLLGTDSVDSVVAYHQTLLQPFTLHRQSTKPEPEPDSFFPDGRSFITLRTDSISHSYLYRTISYNIYT